jgi:hypothetical protein
MAVCRDERIDRGPSFSLKVLEKKVSKPPSDTSNAATFVFEKEPRSRKNNEEHSSF